MFDDIVNALAQRYSLGDKARPFLQMLLARISDPARGGLHGFVERLRTAGMADDVRDWMAAPASAAPVEVQDLEPAIGDDTLVPDLASRFGMDHRSVLAALAYAIPALISRFGRDGAIPATLPAEADTFIGSRADWTTRTSAAPATARVAPAVAPSRNWLPLIVALVVAMGLLAYCTTRDRPETVAPAPVPAAPAPAPSEPEALVEPEGAGVLVAPAGQMPALKVYFDTGKAEVAPEFADKAAGFVEYMGANTITSAVISGFNDPTGDPAANARLAKERAEAVQQALVAAGVPKERTVLEKPADTTGTGATNAASRRVDVVIRE